MATTKVNKALNGYMIPDAYYVFKPVLLRVSTSCKGQYEACYLFTIINIIWHYGRCKIETIDESVLPPSAPDCLTV